MNDESNPRPETVFDEQLRENNPLGTDRSGSAPAIVFWEAIAAGKRQILIRFKDQTYQLRETRNGKLILTK